MVGTGCSSVIMDEKLASSRFKLGPLVKVYEYLGIPYLFPEVRHFIKTKIFIRWITAVAAPIKFANKLIGLVPGIKRPGKHDPPSLDYIKTTLLIPTVSKLTLPHLLLSRWGMFSLGMTYFITLVFPRLLWLLKLVHLSQNLL